MSKERGSGTAMPFGAWKRAPVIWGIYWLGLKANRSGGVIERVGARVMSWALARLARKAGLV